jgi:hypothetical protein
MTDQPRSATRQCELTLMGRLHDAEDDHDLAVRGLRAGVSAEALDMDAQLWRAMGSAIAELARLVSRHCHLSSFCEARPSVGLLTARLSEAIDDQLDGAAWRVVDAQARLEAARTARQ